MLKKSTTGKTPAFIIFGHELQPPTLWRREVECMEASATRDPKSTKGDRELLIKTGEESLGEHTIAEEKTCEKKEKKI